VLPMLGFSPKILGFDPTLGFLGFVYHPILGVSFLYSGLLVNDFARGKVFGRRDGVI